MLNVAGGLGAQRVVGTSITVPTIADLTLDEDELVALALNATAIASDFHKTAPIKHVPVNGRSFLLNGIDRMRKYVGSGANVRHAYMYAPAKAPTVTGQDVISDHLRSPTGICFYGAYVYIADLAHNRVVKLDATTYEHVAQFGTETAGTGNTQLSSPWGVTTDGTHLYITDSGNHRVMKVLLTTMAYVAKIGTSGSGADQFSYPRGITNAGGKLYVADSGNNRIVELTASTMAWSDTFASHGSVTLASPQDVAVDATAGLLYITDAGNYRVVVTDHMIGSDSLATSFGTNGSSSGLFLAPQGIAVNGGHTIFVTDQTRAKALKWYSNHCTGTGTLADGTTKGAAKTTTTATFFVNGATLTKAATDDLFNLSGEADTGVADYRAYLFLLDAAGAASFVASGNETSAALAIAAVMALVPVSKAIIGGYVADPSCDFNGAAGLAAQGTLYDQYLSGWKTQPVFSIETGTFGEGDGEWKIPYGCAVNGTYLYVVDGGSNDRVNIRLTGDLSFFGYIGPTLELSDYGERAYGYLYEDEDGVRTAYSTLANGYHGLTISNVVGGFHSLDPKVTKIIVVASRFRLLDEVYELTTITNNVTGGAWTYTDTTTDDNLGDLPYRTVKRDPSHGVPGAPRTGCVWQDVLWTGGAIIAPSYQVGTATVDAAWSATVGLWRVVGTSTHWTRRMEGRHFALASTPTVKFNIVWVDETNQYLYLGETYSGTTASALAYIVTDDRDPSAAFYSIPGLYEDQPADYFWPCGLGDGDQILAMWPKGAILYVFKQRSIWAITGTSAENFQGIQVSTKVGCDSPNGVVEVPMKEGGSLVTFWSYPAIYSLSGASEPAVISSFLDPVVKTTSEYASERMVTGFDIRERVIVYSTPKDPDLIGVENFAFEYDPRKWCREPGMKFCATGYFFDTNGRQRLCFVDDLGEVWQYGVTTYADGAEAGSLTGTVTAWTSDELKLTSTSSTFDTDLCGAPIFLVASDGTFERNTIVSVSADQRSVYLLKDPEAAVLTTTQFVIGGIEKVWESGAMDQGVTEIEKKYEDLWLDHAMTDCSLAVYAAENEDAFEFLADIDLSTAPPYQLPLSGPAYSFRGKELRLKFQNTLPGKRMTLKGFNYMASWRSTKMG